MTMTNKTSTSPVMSLQGVYDRLVNDGSPTWATPNAYGCATLAAAIKPYLNAPTTGVSGASLAAIGRAHFGNPIPKAWYDAAKELLALVPAPDAVGGDVVAMLQAGFITACSHGPDKDYRLNIKFPTLATLQAAHNALVMAAPRVQGDASEVNARAMELLRTYKTWIGGHRPDRDEDAEEAELWDETESVIAALAAQPKGDVSHPAEQTRGDGVVEPPLAGWWRHGNGHLSCGSLRVARADWEHEVCAAGSMRNEVFDWMCARLNAKTAPRQAVPDGWQLVPIEPTEEMIRNAWGSDTSTSDGNVKRVYAAMLAATPSAGRMGVDRG